MRIKSNLYVLNSLYSYIIEIISVKKHYVSQRFRCARVSGVNVCCLATPDKGEKLVGSVIPGSNPEFSAWKSSCTSIRLSLPKVVSIDYKCVSVTIIKSCAGKLFQFGTH